MAGRILRLAGQNYLNGLPAHHREAATNVLNSILGAAETFDAQRAAVQDNDELSPEGRTAEARKVAVAALTKLAPVDAAVKTLTERAASLEKSLLAKVTYHAPEKTAERIAHEMHLQEIRGQLRVLPASERLNVYRTSTDPMILAAIETATPTLSVKRPDGSQKLEPFIDLEEMSAVKLERAEKADPATATALREIRSLREIYAHAVNGVRREILDEVPGAVAEATV